MARTKQIIKLQDITFGYKDHGAPIFNNFNLNIGHNERVAILGSSGEGKSTLVNIIAGNISPWSGKVLIDGSVIQKPKKIIIMSQENDIFDWLTVQQNMDLVCKDTQRVKHFLDAVGLSANASDRGHTLSTGMKKRLSFARALAVDADILMMDEPFSSLDYPRRQKLYKELLRASEETNITIVLVTHDIHEAVSLCDRIFLVKGRPGELHEISTHSSTTRKIEHSIKQLLAES